MMYYTEYAAPTAAVDALLAEAKLGRLVTVSADGTPHLGLYPFWVSDDRVQLHLNRNDEQLADLAHNTRCLFEIDEVLATIPSYWVDAQNARMATAYYCSVALSCSAATQSDPSVIAEGQNRILARYQPEGGHRPVDANDPLYQPVLSMLCSVTLKVDSRRSKWKLAQNQPPDVRARIAAELRARGHPGDERAANALQWTLDQESAG